MIAIWFLMLLLNCCANSVHPCHPLLSIKFETSGFFDRVGCMESRHEIVIADLKEKELIAALQKRTDADAMRIKRFLAMPDLSRTEGSPLKEVVDRTLKVAVIKDL